MPYSRIYLKSRFKMIWSWKIHVAILIFFPFVWQRCNLSNFDQLISTSSPNGIILNSSQINPPLSITETTYIDCFGAFADFSLPIGFFGWPLWGFRWFQLAYWFLSVDCFGAFADFSLPIGLFRLTALTFSLILACLLASLGDRFEAFADSSLPIGLFRLTTLAFSLILACLSCFFGWLLWGLFLFQLAYRSSLVDCFSAFADFSLLFGFFGWLLWGLFLFQLAYWPLWLTALALSLIPACLLASLVDCFGAFADSSLPISFFGWLLWCFRWF